MDATGHEYPTRDAYPTGNRDPLALSVEQAAESAGVSRSLLYEEMRVGRLKYTKSALAGSFLSTTYENGCFRFGSPDARRDHRRSARDRVPVGAVVALSMPGARQSGSNAGVA